MPSPKDKIVQIAVSPGSGNSPDILYALDTNGGIWQRYMEMYRPWERVPTPSEEAPPE